MVTLLKAVLRSVVQIAVQSDCGHSKSVHVPIYLQIFSVVYIFLKQFFLNY